MRTLALTACLAGTVALGLVPRAYAEAAPQDRGIFSELDAELPIEQAPPPTDGRARSLLVDERHHLATLYYGADPVGLYPYPLPPSAVASLAGVPERRGSPPASEDRDGDGIVDRLDIVRGGKKLLANKAAYIERYVGMKYPGGDVPRTEGVCSDTIIRALRNAGIDLQREVHEDILRARAAYPMVEKVDASINHRRVKTLIPWFKRHFASLPVGDDFQPGDVVFFDTFPSKAGAEHVGIVSDRRGHDGKLLVVNNWTNGTVDAEMALLSSIPVTHHFRVGRGQPTPTGSPAGHATR